MLYLTCTTITSVDLAHYGISRVKDWVSGDCGTNMFKTSNFVLAQLRVVDLLYWPQANTADIGPVTGQLQGNYEITLLITL